MPSLVWFGQLIDLMKKNFFYILKNSQFVKFAKFRMKNHFFLGKLYQQLFCFNLSLHCWYSMPSLVWLGQLLDPMKKNFLKILINSQLAKFAKFRMKNHFFLDKLYQQLFGSTLSLHWWYSISSSVWFGQLLDPMKKNFLKFSKIRNSHENPSSLWNSVWKPIFFRMKTHLFPYETHLFFPYENSVWKFRMKTHLFFPRPAIPTNFSLYTLITLVILNIEFDLIWTTSWPDEKDFFLNFQNFAIREIRKFPYGKPFFS